MNARTSWSAKADRSRAGKKAPDQESELPIDGLLDARFDEEGRLSQIGRAGNQRSAERLDPRPPAMSPEELERAVQKLSQGLEAIERESNAQTQPESRVASDSPTPERRDFVTYSLDRLEARLETLSKRLAQRAAGSEQESSRETSRPASATRSPKAADAKGDPSLAVEPQPEAPLDAAALRRSEAARALREAEAAAEQRRRAEALEAQRRAEAAEAERRAEAAEAAETRRRAEAAEAERRALNVAQELKRHFVALETRIEELQKSADDNQIEPVRQELMDLLRQIEELRRNGHAVSGSVEQVRVRLDDVETKVAAARNLAGNRIGDLQDRLTGLSGRIDEIEVEIPGFDAVRENQAAILERFDRMEGLVNQLDFSEELVERVDGVRRQVQTVASHEEVVRIEGRIQDLADHLDALPEQLSDRDALERIAAEMESVGAELAEARRQRDLSGAQLNQRLAELSAGVRNLGDRDYSPDMTVVEDRLSEISTGLRDLNDRDYAPDMTGVEDRLLNIATRIDDTHRSSTERLARLDQRLAALTAAVEAEEDDAAAEILSGLGRRMDALAEAIEAQDARGTRRDLAGLDRKLDQLSDALHEQADRFTPPQLEPLEERLEQMQRHLEEMARRSQLSTAQFGPFSQRLQEISERLSGLGSAGQGDLTGRLAAIEERLAGLAGRGQDTRALHTQLESIVSRLELLKGRSIDPARLSEMFERVDSAIRTGSAEERLQRIEKKIEASAIPADRFERLERKIEQSAVPAERFERLERRIEQSAVPVDRFERLERKIEQSAVPTERFERMERTIAESVRSDIGEERYHQLESRIAENALASIAEQRFTRLEQLLQSDRQDGAVAERLSQIERMLEAGVQGEGDAERLARLEQKLDTIGRASGVAGEGLTPEDVADLSTDIVALRRELRSLPGLGEGEGNLSAVLKAVAERLDRIPNEPPAMSPELATQFDRIAQLLEDPSHNRLALAHIEQSLKAIEQRLEDRGGFYQAAGDTIEDSGHFQTVAGLARALSDDVTELRGSAEASEKKTRDALDAVQDTLQAVVKRMAFLERDVDLRTSSAGDISPAPVAEKPAPVAAPVIDPPVVPARLPESDLPPVVIGRAAESDSPPVAPAEPPVPTAKSGGLFSRFTSSQLLKRATGGRAESFSPDSDEVDDLADLPLEPGTDSPLDSALTGAPSSDTARMSGARKGRLNVGRSPTARVALYPTADTETGDDFLAAARRAAQAATDEADDFEVTVAAPVPPRASNRGRLAVLGGALAIAVAIAAVQIVRTQIEAPDVEIASLPSPQPSGAEEASQPTIRVIEPAPQDSVEPVMLPEAESPAAAEEDELAVQEPQEDSAPPVDSPSPADGAIAARGEWTPAAEPAAEEPAEVETAAIPPPSTGLPAVADPSDGLIPVELGPSRLREAAIAGDPLAAFEVAARYAEGRGIVQDMPAAVEWYTRAAESGLAPAQYRLGSIYEKGLGVPQDLAAAQDWYTRAADAGNVKAMHNLAVLYAEGAGGEPDLEEAASLFRQAAEHGVRDSQFNLAILHARGLGVRQDMAEAYRWFAIAASSGDAEAAKRRDIIGAALPAEELAAAQAVAEEFHPLPLIAEANDVMMPEGGWGEDSTSVELETTTDLVALVQLLLSEQGYDPGPTDGLLGTQTIRAITAFQEEEGLPTTGEIDASLVAALQAPST